MAELRMVQELALLIEDNLSSKHLVLSIEEMLVEFLQDFTSPNGVLELEPMTAYHRMLVHRLADIFGIAHESVGEGDDRHLVLERSPESVIPAVLVSDILSQYGHHQSLMPSPQLLRRENLPESKLRQTSSVSSSLSLEEREAAYLAARKRIFSSDKGMDEPIPPKPRNVPVVARRMIAHALGHRIYKASLDTESQKSNGDFCLVEHSTVDPNCVESANSGDVNEHPVCESNSRECIVGSCMETEISSDVLRSERKGSSVAEDKMEHLGAAKRMFTQALGISSAKETNVPPSAVMNKNQKPSR